MSARLTLKRLRAIEEALIFRLAGEIEPLEDEPSDEDYDKALEWASDQIAKRSPTR